MYEKCNKPVYAVTAKMRDDRPKVSMKMEMW